MKCGKLTAKLRDAVQVRFYENGREIKRYKNIEIPDAIKELEFTGFKFDVPESGPITFKIYFKPGTLPETWPEARQRKTRTPKDAETTPDTAQAAMEKPPAEAWMLARMLDGAALAEAAEAAQAAGYARNEIYRAKLRIADMFDDE